MADEAELKITIIPDEEANVAAAQTVEVKKSDDTVKAEVKDPAMLELMSQYKELETKSAATEKRANEAEQARQTAEREAARHRDEAETAKKQTTSSHLDTITTAISASEQDVDGAKAAIRAAKASGDVEAEIEAQDRLAKARATMIRLDEAKQDIETRIKNPPKREAPPQLDPVEAFAKNRTPATASWIRAHPEYVKSDKGIRKLTAADAIAQAEDLVPDTPEYFARVEDYLGIKKSEAPAPKVAPTEASQVLTKPRSGAPPVAPGASVSGNGGGGDGGAVILTAREAAAAQDGTLIWNYPDPSGKNRWKKGDPIGLQEMARRKMTGTKQGLYDRSFTES